MKIFVIVGVLTLALGTLPVRAEDAAPAPGAAAQPQEKSAQGCMPDGGCCAACAAVRAQAQAQAEQAHGSATSSADTGGCPCKRVQQ